MCGRVCVCVRERERERQTNRQTERDVHKGCGGIEGRSQLAKPWRKWDHNIKKDLKGIGWEGVEWIDVTCDPSQWRAVVNTVMNLLVT